MADNKLGKLSQLDMGGVIKNVHDEQSGSLFTNRVKSQVPGSFDRAITTYTNKSLSNIKFYSDDRNEITEVLTLADVSGSLNNTYFTLTSALDGTLYHVWFNVAAAGTDPAPADSTAIEIALATNDPSYIVAKAIEIFVGGNSDFEVNIAGTLTSNIVLISNASNGETTDTSDFDTGFSFSVTQEGRSVLIADISPTQVVDVCYFWNESEGRIEAKSLASASDIKTDISLGLVNGKELKFASGFNDDIDTANTEIIATQGGVSYPYPTSADTLDIASSSALDTIAGTGARALRIEGLDANRLEITEDIALDGTSTVVTALSYIRVNSVAVITGGSTGENQGTISVNHTTSGDLLSEIIISSTGQGQNRAFNTIQSIPLGKTALLALIVVSITRRAGTTGVKEGEIQIRVRPLGGVFAPGNITGIRNDGTTSIQVPLDYPAAIPGGSDIEFIGNVFVNNSSITATYSYILVDNEIYGL